MTDNIVDITQRRDKKASPGITVIDQEDLTLVAEDGSTLLVYVTHYEFEGQTEELLIYAKSLEEAERRIQAIMTRLDLVGQLTKIESYLDD